MIPDIRIADFDYNLPDSKIPKHPLEKRDECKLLLRNPKGRIFHRKFKELADLLPVGTFLVCNDTRVINARLTFKKETGANIELFLLEPVYPSDYALNFQSRSECVWKCLVGNSKKWKEGNLSCILPVKSDLKIDVLAERLETESNGTSHIKFSWDNNDYSFGDIVEAAGRIPIPPYLNRETEYSDLEDYQTVYAKVKGSVAAPTAGLHFTPFVFDDLEAHNISVGKVTLHVGAGTFLPVKSEKIEGHPMHSEPFTVSKELLLKLTEWKKLGKPVVAVGTTTVRTLESLPYIGLKVKTGTLPTTYVSQWEPYSDNDFDTVEALQELLSYLERQGMDSISVSTSIMIAPGFKWRMVDGMVTNFHQPKSTLLLLVSSFLGNNIIGENKEEWRDLYNKALLHDYRFLSYGDACLLLNKK